MNLWRLLSARLQNGRRRVLLLMAASAILTAAVIIDLAERVAADPAWEIPVGLGGALLAVTAAGYWQARARIRLGQAMAGVSRQIRRALLSGYRDLEPAAREEVDKDAARDALASLPAGLGSPGAEVAAVAQSYLTTIGCAAVALAIDPVAGAALLLALKLAAIVATALVLRARGRNADRFSADAGVDRAVQDAVQGAGRALRAGPASLARQSVPIDRAIAERKAQRAPAIKRAATEGAAGAVGQIMLAAVLAAATRLSGEPADQAAAVLLIAFLVPLDWIEAIPRLTVLSAAADRLAAFETALRAAARRWSPPPPHDAGAFASLSLRDVVYAYPARPGQPGAIVGPVSCDVATGRALFIVGGPGSGKTTLLNMIAGLAVPEGGEVLRNGAPGDARLSRNQAALASAGQALFAGMRVTATDRTETIDLIRDLGLSGSEQICNGRVPDPADLPAGVRTRIAILLAIASDRPVLLFDEVDALLSPVVRAHLFGTLIPRLCASGKAIVVATQDERLAAATDAVVRLS